MKTGKKFRVGNYLVEKVPVGGSDPVFRVSAAGGGFAVELGGSQLMWAVLDHVETQREMDEIGDSLAVMFQLSQMHATMTFDVEYYRGVASLVDAFLARQPETPEQVEERELEAMTRTRVLEDGVRRLVDEVSEEMTRVVKEEDEA